MAADLTPVYYVVGTAASITGILASGRSLYVKQKRRWTDEGAAASAHNNALKANTDAATKNTQAIAALTTKLDTFATEVRGELNGHQRRIDRIEDVIEAPMRTRRTPGREQP